MAEAGLKRDFRLVRRAACEGVAEGLREHLPGGMGILIKGGATCVVCGILHFAFGLDVATTLIGGGLGGTGLAVLDRRRNSPP